MVCREARLPRNQRALASAVTPKLWLRKMSIGIEIPAAKTAKETVMPDNHG